MKRELIWWAIILVSTNVLTLRAETPSLDAVLKACEQKTIVMGRDEKGNYVEAGEQIDSYCRGFLEGIFTYLVRAGTICSKDKNTSPEFLLSTVLTYQTQTKSQDKDAARVLEAAFKRAFSCQK